MPEKITTRTPTLFRSFKTARKHILFSSFKPTIPRIPFESSKMGLGVADTPIGEDAIRLFLMLADVVGISLCFIGLRAAYVVLGSTLIVSFVFNAVSILAQGNETRQKLKKNQPVRPNIFALSIEMFGTIALLVMWVISVVDATAWDYQYSETPLLIRAYGGIAGLVAL